MSSKVSLLRALRRQKKEGEGKARGERRRRRPIVVARTSSLRRFFRRHGVVHVPYVCFCEDKWRKKKFFWSTNSQKPKAIVYPPPLLPKSVRVSPRRRGARTLDQRRPRESPKYRPTERSSRSIIWSQKKRKKRKEKGPPREKLSNFTNKRLFLSSIGVKLWTHKNTPHKTLERRTTQNTRPSWRTQNQWLNSPRYDETFRRRRTDVVVVVVVVVLFFLTLISSF